MAGRGRPRKEDVIAKKEAQARAEGKTYGELAAEEQRKAVKVQQDDGVVRTTMKDRIKHIPKRSLAAHENVLREIKEDIQSHKQCIKTQQEEIEQDLMDILNTGEFEVLDIGRLRLVFQPEDKYNTRPWFEVRYPDYTGVFTKRHFLRKPGQKRRPQKGD